MKSFLVFGLLVVAFSASAAQNVRVAVVTSSSITVTWSVTQSEGVTAYRVRSSKPNLGWFRVTQVPASSNRMTIDNLDPDTEYKIQVMEMTDDGYQGDVGEITATTYSVAPSMRVTAVTSSSITVTWSATKTEETTSFKVDVQDLTTRVRRVIEVDSCSDGTTIDNLAPDTRYRLQVTRKTPNGLIFPPSEAIVVKTTQ